MKINDFLNKDSAKISAKDYRYFGYITDIRKRTLNNRVVYSLYVYMPNDFKEKNNIQERKNYYGEIILYHLNGNSEVKTFNFSNTTKEEVKNNLRDKKREYLKRGVFRSVKIGNIIS